LAIIDDVRQAKAINAGRLTDRARQVAGGAEWEQLGK
jgi:hypothetical protein